MSAWLKKNTTTGIIILMTIMLLVYFCFPENFVLLIPPVAGILAVFIYFMIFEIRHLILFLAFIIPLSFPVHLGFGLTLTFPSEPIAALLGAYTVWLVMFRKKNSHRLLFHPVTIIILTDLLWTFITTLTSASPEVSLKRLLIKTLYVIVYYFLMTFLFEKSGNIKRIFYAYCTGLIIPVAYTFYHHSHYHFNSQSSINIGRPFFTDHTLYGAVLAFIMPFILYAVFLNRHSKKLLFIFSAGFIIVCIALFYSYSRAAWLSIICAFVFFLITMVRIKPVLIYSMLIIAAVIVYTNQNYIYDRMMRSDAISNKENVGDHIQSVTNIRSDVSNAERINRWKCALRMFKDKPLTGFGPGTYQFYYGQYQIPSEMTRISTYRGNKGHAHSEYLNYLSETGLPGLVIFLLLIIISLHIGLKIIYQTKNKDTRYVATFLISGLITLYLHSFFNGFMDTDKIAMLVFSSLAALTSLDIQPDEENIIGNNITELT